MATVTRPAGGYTPSNPITNTTKYQDDSAATSPRVAISSVKVDGDLNKAFDVLTDHDNAIADHETRIDSLEAATPGTVTSVAVAAPSEFSVSGSPVTTNGTITISKANQSANVVYAGPGSGSATAPTFRALVAADLPAATDSAQGAVELATTAEVQTGTDTGRAITPAGLAGAIGYTARYESAATSFTAGGGGTFTHGLGRRPQLVQVYYQCVSAEGNYQVNDEVLAAGNGDNNTNIGINVWARSTTDLLWRIGSGGVVLNNATTGAQFLITPANWRIIVRAWA